MKCFGVKHRKDLFLNLQQPLVGIPNHTISEKIAVCGKCLFLKVMADFHVRFNTLLQ